MGRLAEANGGTKVGDFHAATGGSKSGVYGSGGKITPHIFSSRDSSTKPNSKAIGDGATVRPESSERPERSESFDISHHSGTDTGLHWWLGKTGRMRKSDTARSSFRGDEAPVRKGERAQNDDLQHVRGGVVVVAIPAAQEEKESIAGIILIVADWGSCTRRRRPWSRLQMINSDGQHCEEGRDSLRPRARR